MMENKVRKPLITERMKRNAKDAQSGMSFELRVIGDIEQILDGDVGMLCHVL